MVKDFSYGVIPFVIEDEKIKYLLIHSVGSDGYWGFPKGHKEGEETDLYAARRELKEETGIAEIKILESKIFYDHFTHTFEQVEYDKTVALYPGFLQTRPKLKLQPEEVDAAEWLDYETAMTRIPFESLKNTLSEANDWLKQNQTQT